jgi:murein tripeptide amidase MpaA
MSMTLSVTSAFDGGNIAFSGIVTGANGETEVQLNIKDDEYTEFEKKSHKQWFYFRASGFVVEATAGDSDSVLFTILNAGQCSFPKAFNDYNVCASYDRKDWFRTPTTFNEETGKLQWSFKSASSMVYFAYFEPYSHERHLDLIAACNAQASSTAPDVWLNKDGVNVRSLGNTLDGRSMDLVTIGTRIDF